MLDNQNLTWQGTITFIDTNQKLPFRSVLELIKLMDSAITAAGFGDDLESVPNSDPSDASEEADD